jgi:3-hydroxyisobutyrate dehydrogenase-like beta-hydroxyacid dehydrogenase
VGEFAEVVELSVTDDAAVEAAVLGRNGVLEGAKPGTIIAVHSTVHPRTVKKIAEEANPRGVGVLDAAPSGGAAGARDHALLWMVGGEAADLARCRPIFETSGKNIFHMGPLGMGSAAKCAQQMITTVNMLAAYEGFRVANAVGLDLDAFNRALHVSTGQSFMADRWLNGFFHGMAARSRDGFYKGLIPCLTLANEAGVSAPGTAVIQQLFREFPEPA